MAPQDALDATPATSHPRRPDEVSGLRRRCQSHSRYVIERHDAASPHFDFRLEIGGVLVSWVIPQAPSLDPGDKQLALRTDDVPPDGNRDTGTPGALVWDSGTYDNVTDKPVEQALNEGTLRVRFEGRALRGAFAMARIRQSPAQEQWLLIKADDTSTDSDDSRSPHVPPHDRSPGSAVATPASPNSSDASTPFAE